MEYITIEKLSKEINRSEAVLRRMKGSRIISHSSLKNNSDTYKIQLLSKVNNENNSTYKLDELKIYTAFSLFVKGKPKSYKEDIPKVEKLLKDKDIDKILRDLIKKNEFSITEEEINKKITMEFCIRILKIIYGAVEIEQEYESNEVFNIKIEEEINNDLVLIENEKICNYDYANILDYIFNKYSKKEKGYFPLQHPTGNGKTFFLEKFLIKNIMEDFENLRQNKIIVITSSKVNVNEIYRNVEKKLIKDGYKEKINYVFQMKSVADILSETDFIKEFIQELDKDLYFYEKLSHNFVDNLKRDLKELIIFIEKKVPIEDKLSKINRDYIYELKKHIFKYFKLKDKKNKTEKEWKEYKKIELPNFLYKLYPMLSEENNHKKIYIMTTDKFLYGYVGQKETKNFYNEKGNLIFIDEIDSAKQNFLKYIENQRTLVIRNIVNVFNERYNSFSKRENNQIFSLLRRLIAIEKETFDDIRKNSSNPEEKIEKIKLKKKELIQAMENFEKAGKELRKKYFTTKRYYEMEEMEKINLVEDENHYFQNGGEKYYLNINDENSLITKKATDLPLSDMLRNLFNYCYGHFYYLLMLIYNYHISLKSEEEIEREIISHFFYNVETQKEINNELKNFFMKRIRKKKIKNEEGSEIEVFNVEDENKRLDLRICCFQITEDNPDYTLNNRVLIGGKMMYETPESLFYEICKENLIFGISATANIETCIGNFDLKWLKSTLKDNYYTLTASEKTKLEESLKKINKFEENIERRLNIFGKNGGKKLEFEAVKLLEQKKGGYNKLRNIIDSCLINEEDEFDSDIQREYFEYAVSVFYNFLQEKESSSLLFISNRLTQKKNLEKAAHTLEKVLKKKVHFKDLSSKTLNKVLETRDEESNELMKNLENHKIKTIIFTTYQSAGTGVNIKHLYNKRALSKKLIKIDNDIQKEIQFPLEYKDIDEIAIENKTHLVNFNDDYMKLEMMYYCNLMVANNIIDKKTRSLLLNKNDNKIFTNKYKSSYDYVENSMGRIIQAIGRCNRTKVRNRIRNIYLDEAGFDIIKKFEPRNRLFIGDVNFILEEAKKLKIQDIDNLQKNILILDKKMERFFEETYIAKIDDYNKIMNFSKDENLRAAKKEEFKELYQKYNDFRKYILKNPTRSSRTEKNLAYFSIDKKIDGYTVIRDTNIFFDTAKKNVSLNECRLKEISAIPLLREFCLKNIGFFEENDEIILPYIYQAIFKGMLGELIIKEIFKMYEIKVKNIEEMIEKGIVEVFDDVSENGMYIDYKNYNFDKITAQKLLADKIKRAIDRKQRFINNKNKLFFINLISSNTEKSGRSIAFYKIEDILKEKICNYDESEIIIVSGILRYKEDRETLEINHGIVKKLKKMLGERNE